MAQNQRPSTRTGRGRFFMDRGGPSSDTALSREHKGARRTTGRLKAGFAPLRGSTHNHARSAAMPPLAAFAELQQARALGKVRRRADRAACDPPSRSPLIRKRRGEQIERAGPRQACKIGALEVRRPQPQACAPAGRAPLRSRLNHQHSPSKLAWNYRL
jgi:hypothetical protein